ncbi:GreA/GreB family elongation factor [Deinococcus apachensis]|uniref:GreA/GreB family elongation factor n=1 Tax=Deinococcus apachensis TaxID=309886 RepID=UPI0003766305|nr:GreA/GreB family elongation factor [Deinococcus apachensis]
MTQKIELTQNGFERLRRTLTHEYERLDEARRVVQEQMHANENENLGLEAAQRELMAIQDRIADIEDSLARAVIIERAGDGDDRAMLGAVVTLLDVETGRELRLQLVNPLEASAVAGELPRVSTESPVGRELLGRRVGETFTVNLGRRQANYRVQNVSG